MDILRSNPSSIGKLFWSSEALNALTKENVDNDKYPVISDFIVYTIPSVIIITLIRYVIETGVVKPFANKRFLAVSNRKLENARINLSTEQDKGSGITVDTLEKIFAESSPKLPDINRVKEISKSSNNTIPIEKINRWFRIKQETVRDRIKVERFSESVWRLLVYCFTFLFGLAALSRESWYSQASAKSNSFALSDDTTHVLWESFPLGHTIENMTRVFYIGVQLPLYIHLLIFHTFVDHRRQDFWEMFAHHVLVILLMTFSYIGNFVRAGCVILLCHDITDLFLESSKIFNYLKSDTLTAITFNLFVIFWGFYRLYTFPFVFVRSFWIESPKYNIISSSAFTFASVLLILLILLNAYWFRLIIKLWYNMMLRPASKVPGSRKGDAAADESTDGGESDSSYLSDLGEGSGFDNDDEDADNSSKGSSASTRKMKKHDD